MDELKNQGFLLSVESYRNEGLNLFLDIRIQSKEENQFDALLSLKSQLTLEELRIKDAYTIALDIKIESNTLLPENEIDFFEAHRRYKIENYSQTARQLANQIKDFLGEIFFEKIEFKVFLKP